MNEKIPASDLNTDSREINSMRNISMDIIYLIVTFLGNYFSKRAVIVALGFEYYGIQGLFSNVFMLFSFAEAGIAAAMTFSLYKPIAEKDYAKIDALYYYFKKIYGVLSLIILGLSIGGMFFLKVLTDTKLDYPTILYYYTIFMAQTIVYNLFIYKGHLLIADQKRYIYTTYATILDGLGLVLGIVVLYTGYGFAVFLHILVLKNLMLSLILHRSVKKKYPFLLNKNTLPPKEKKKIVDNVRDLFIYSLSDRLLSTTDIIFVAIFLGTVYVGLYSSYQFIIAAITSIVCTIFGALAASVGNLLTDREAANKFQICSIAQVVNMWVTGVVTVCFFFLVQDFITLWIGDEAILSMAVVWTTTIAMYFTTIRQSIRIFREAAGLFRKARKAIIAKALLNVVLSLILGYFWGIPGIVLATIIATLTTTYWYESYVLYKTYFRVSIRRDALFQIGSILCFAVCLGINGIFAKLIVTSGWLTLLAKGAVVFMVSNGFYIIVLSFHKEAFGALKQMGCNFIAYIKMRKTGA